MGEAINKSQACEATRKHLGLKRFTDAKSELYKLGFDSEARGNGTKRLVAFKFDNKAVPIALKEEASGAASSRSAAAIRQ